MRRLLVLAFSIFLAGSVLAFESDETVDLYSALAANPDFSIFTQLLTDMGMAEELQTGGPYTVFAVSNDTFEAHREETGTDLTADPEMLERILDAHIVQGRFTVLDLRELEESVMTMSGIPLEITIEADGLAINNVNLVSTDVENSFQNGIIHVVDDVMMPPVQTQN